MEIDYRNQQRREETFRQWSISDPGAKAMASAGFIFTGRQLFSLLYTLISQINYQGTVTQYNYFHDWGIK